MIGRKLYIIVEDGLVSDVLIDKELIPLVGEPFVLNLDDEAPDGTPRRMMAGVIQKLPWLNRVDYVTTME